MFHLSEIIIGEFHFLRGILRGIMSLLSTINALTHSRPVNWVDTTTWTYGQRLFPCPSKCIARAIFVGIIWKPREQKSISGRCQTPVPTPLLWVCEGQRKHVRHKTRRTCDLATLAKPQDSCLAQLARMAYALPHSESGWCMAQSQLKPRATTASYWQLLLEASGCLGLP